MGESTGGGEGKPGGGKPSKGKRRGGGLLRIAVVIGVIAVVLAGAVVVLGPTLAASVVSGTISGSYSDSIRGNARADRVSTPWFGPIVVEGLVVEDGAGERVASGDVTAGIGLLGVIAGSVDYGEIRISGEADVRADEGGTTNLERALEPVDPEAPASDGPLIAPGTRATVVLEPSDARYSDPGLREMTGGRVGSVLISGATGTVRIEPGAPITIDLDAPLRTVRPGDDAEDAGTPSGSSSGRLAADLEADVPTGATRIGEITLSGTVSLAGLPTALVDAIAGAGGTIGGVLGEDVGVEIATDGLSSAGGTLAIDASSPQADLRYRGEVRADDGGASSLVATEDTVLRVSGIADRFGTQAAGIVPLFASVRKNAGEHEPAELRLTRFEIPLGADADPLRAIIEGVIDPGMASYELTRPLAALMRVAGGENGSGMLGGRLGQTNLSMADGVLRYADLTVPIGEYSFTSEAAFDLLNGTEDITVRVPAGAIADDIAGGLGGAFERIAEDRMVPIYRRGPLGENNPFEPDFASVLEDAVGPGGILEDRIRKGIEDLIPPDVRKGLPNLPGLLPGGGGDGG